MAAPRRPLTFAPRTEDDARPDLARKARGSVSNRPSPRFGNADRYEIDDGWSDAEEAEWAAGRPKTILGVDTARHIISRNTSPDVGFSQSINPYKGCEHGCIYCFARPTHAYLDLSPGLDFETRIFRKPDAAARLRAELSDPKYKAAPIVLGINTDAYQPTEKSERITRQLLEVFYEFRHPVSIITKSALIQRDLDLLSIMAAEGLFSASVSITTLDRALSHKMEPRAAAPVKRLETIKALTSAGIRVSVMCAPVIPGLTDHEMEAILKASAEAGADKAGYTVVRLPHEVKILFEEWLRANYPDRAEKVLGHIRQTREGKLYNAEFGKRMTGTGQHADLIRQRFQLAVRKYGLDGSRRGMDDAPRKLDYSQFRGGNPQLDLF